MARGVIVEYDFTAIDGAGLLHDTTKKYLAQLDAIPFNSTVEAKYLAGGNYQGGLQDYFNVIKTKKTAVKSARELSIAFNERLTSVIADSAIAPDFIDFVKALKSRGVKTVIATRANIEVVKNVFEPILDDLCVLYHEESTCYGAVKWDSWRRATVENGLSRLHTMVVTGSGFGVKAALLAGMGSLVVINPHVAYQDFTGADEIVPRLNAKAAAKAAEILRI